MFFCIFVSLFNRCRYTIRFLGLFEIANTICRVISKYFYVFIAVFRQIEWEKHWSGKTYRFSRLLSVGSCSVHTRGAAVALTKMADWCRESVVCFRFEETRSCKDLMFVKINPFSVQKCISFWFHISKNYNNICASSSSRLKKHIMSRWYN
jgi:hypothetical protein